jgi:NAD(P)-dependent dehydrogenase (short-subunit alcohol dehydrogenase family)
MPTQDLSGSTAIVTGASSGGRGVAGALALAVANWT